MMTSAILSFLVLFAATTAAAPPESSIKEVALDKEFEVRFGQLVSIKKEGLKISFKDVAEDSRCPTGVECIWAGNAKIVVFIKNNRRRAYTIKLNTGVEPKQDNFIMKYDIKLVSLSPYPKKGAIIMKSDYVATLVVSRRRE
ncbi:MAG: hypothetical protein QOH25_799 [Acidobacteriota bacterium]|jgi:hypothetical protein|nr:hypothetical protein [Acidobacteriota bacterium]